ncbi:hypothetical protein QLR68_28575, partial [Micromonospora sp. DH15]|nr:hypothetical protein [Micromonospora sp. DH15]
MTCSTVGTGTGSTDGLVVAGSGCVGSGRDMPYRLVVAGSTRARTVAVSPGVTGTGKPCPSSTMTRAPTGGSGGFPTGRTRRPDAAWVSTQNSSPPSLTRAKAWRGAFGGSTSTAANAFGPASRTRPTICAQSATGCHSTPSCAASSDSGRNGSIAASSRVTRGGRGAGENSPTTAASRITQSSAVPSYGGSTPVRRCSRVAPRPSTGVPRAAVTAPTDTGCGPTGGVPGPDPPAGGAPTGCGPPVQEPTVGRPGAAGSAPDARPPPAGPPAPASGAAPGTGADPPVRAPEGAPPAAPPGWPAAVPDDAGRPEAEGASADAGTPGVEDRSDVAD